VLESSALTRRVVIPEACLWDPESPFLYQGVIELWQDGQRCDQVIRTHGLRSFHLSERGLRVNGRSLALRGRLITGCSDEEALMLRQAGCNLFVASVAEQTLPLWAQADRLGFLMLGRVTDDREQTRRSLEELSRHPSCLGWIVEETQSSLLDSLPAGSLVGLECESLLSESILARVHFLVGPPELANLGKPLLVKGDRPTDLPAGSVILGSIL
jgi:hypothetical protein